MRVFAIPNPDNAVGLANVGAKQINKFMTDKSDRFYDWFAGLGNSLSRHFLVVPRWLQILAAIALILGIGLRFTNLDTQVFASQETYTLLRISGYTVAQVESEIFTGDIISQNQLARFQYPPPNSQFQDTIFSLAVETPESPPLYYMLARLWVLVWGNSVLAIRSLSAIISLAVFPSMYWLCRELFKVPHAVGMIAIAFVAVSPIHLLFAQEARESTLWMVTILLSSAAFLRAVRLHYRRVSHPTKTWSWIVYAAILTANFYTFLLGIFVAVAHGLYLLLFVGLRGSRLMVNYATAVLWALMAFLPWIVVVINNYQSIGSREESSRLISRLELIQDWLRQIQRIFFDFNMGISSQYEVIFTPLAILLVGYAIYFLIATTNIQVWGFILALIFIPTGVIILADLGLGETRSLVAKNMIPAYLAIQITVAYLLAHHIYNGLMARRQIWQIITIVILVSGLLTGLQIIQSDVWWNKPNNYGNPEIANIINPSSRPLLIASNRNTQVGEILSLSYSLKSSMRYQLTLNNNISPRSNANNNTIFILNPTSGLRRSIVRQYGQNATIRYSDGGSHSLWEYRNLVLYQLNSR